MIELPTREYAIMSLLVEVNSSLRLLLALYERTKDRKLIDDMTACKRLRDYLIAQKAAKS